MRRHGGVVDRNRISWPRPRGHRVLWVLVVLALLAGRDVSRAAEPESLDVGSRVRISSIELGLRASQGIVRALGHDTLTVMLDAKRVVREIPLRSISKLELKVGQKSHALQGAGMGLFVGALAGGAIGGAAGSGDSGFAALHVVVGIAGGALGGLLVGTLVGAAIPSGRWETVHQVGDVQLGVRVLEGNAVGATVSLVR